MSNLLTRCDAMHGCDVSPIGVTADVTYLHRLTYRKEKYLIHTCARRLFKASLLTQHGDLYECLITHIKQIVCIMQACLI